MRMGIVLNKIRCPTFRSQAAFPITRIHYHVGMIVTPHPRNDTRPSLLQRSALARCAWAAGAALALWAVVAWALAR